MDANGKLDRVAVGLRSGLIVLFTLTYDTEARGAYNESILNVEETELGVRSHYLLFSFTQARFSH
jgi:hypothetical protein